MHTQLQVRSATQRGDHATALTASKSAHKLSVIIGIIVFVAVLLISVPVGTYKHLVSYITSRFSLSGGGREFFFCEATERYGRLHAHFYWFPRNSICAAISVNTY